MYISLLAQWTQGPVYHTPNTKSSPESVLVYSCNLTKDDIAQNSLCQTEFQHLRKSLSIKFKSIQITKLENGLWSSKFHSKFDFQLFLFLFWNFFLKTHSQVRNFRYILKTATVSSRWSWTKRIISKLAQKHRDWISYVINIAKGTTNPRVEFLSQVQTQILIKFHLQNLDQASSSKSRPNIGISAKLKIQNIDQTYSCVNLVLPKNWGAYFSAISVKSN